MIQSFIITGFLGVGKTTMLTNTVKEHFSDKKVAIVVNEFGDIGIDGDILSNVYSEVLEISEDDAERVLDGRDTVWEHGGGGEFDWWVQGKQGECAKKMGFEAAEGRDEQGHVYIVPMFDRENDLVLDRVDSGGYN